MEALGWQGVVLNTMGPLYVAVAVRVAVVVLLNVTVGS